MVGWRGWAAGVVALLAVACGGTGGGSVSRQSGTGEAGTDGDSGVVDAGEPASGPDAGAPTDAGGTGGSGTDDAGSGGSGGSPDSGAGAGVDAGTGDGGTGGPIACGEPAPADVCRQLNPPLGIPVVHQEMEVPSDVGEGLSCGTGAYPSSGTGVVLHRMQPDYRPPRLDFVDRSGAELFSDDGFSIATFDITVISQPTGFGIFAPYIGGIGHYPLGLQSDHGVGRGGGVGYRVFELPDGGVGLFSFRENAPGCGEQTRVFVQRFEDSGAKTPADPTDLGCFPQTPDVAMAGNAAGNVLVLTNHLSTGYTGWDGIWLDADLRVVQRFRTPELDAAVNNKDAAVAALLDGSFVMRFDEKWQLRIQPNATTTEPAPCWLAARPGTDVRITRDRNAYALVTPGAKSCDAALELFTPQGESCGPVGPLESGDDTCDVAIGRDGTISGSAYAADAGAGQPRACILKFWPAALGPTDL
jgi:hypothetical protein